MSIAFRPMTKLVGGTATYAAVYDDRYDAQVHKYNECARHWKWMFDRLFAMTWLGVRSATVAFSCSSSFCFTWFWRRYRNSSSLRGRSMGREHRWDFCVGTNQVTKMRSISLSSCNSNVLGTRTFSENRSVRESSFNCVKLRNQRQCFDTQPSLYERMLLGIRYNMTVSAQLLLEVSDTVPFPFWWAKTRHPFFGRLELVPVHHYETSVSSSEPTFRFRAPTNIAAVSCCENTVSPHSSVPLSPFLLQLRVPAYFTSFKVSLLSNSIYSQLSGAVTSTDCSVVTSMSGCIDW